MTQTWDDCDFEEQTSPPYCDAYFYCSTQKWACSLSARHGFFGLFLFGECPPCGLLVLPPTSARLRASISPGRAAGRQYSAVKTANASTTAIVWRVSVSSAGVEAFGGGSIAPALSADGRYVAFDSSATNLVAGDTNGKRDVFVYDRTTQQTTMVSVSSDGTPGNGDSMSASISADGRYVAFISQATNMVNGDTNGLADVFVHDRQTGETTRVNVGPNGVQANGETWPDGDIYRYTADEMANTQIAISGDGRYVAFVSLATNLAAAPPDTVPVGVCIRDRQTSTTSCVTTPIAAGNASGTFRPSVALSSDGRYVAIATGGRHLVDDTNGQRDVYVYDRNTGQIERVSVSTAGVQGDAASGWPAISADGRYVAFGSDASNLIAGETNVARNIYLRDRQTSVTTRIPGVHVSARAVQPSISGDGRYVAYSMPLFGLSVFDSQNNTVHAVTDAGPADGQSFGAAISGDGQVIAFGSASADLVAGDTNSQDDVFVTLNVPTPPPPSVSLDKPALVFGATTTGTAFAAATGAQAVRLTQSGSGTVTWIATSNEPWLTVRPASGTGTATLSVGVAFAAGLPASGSTSGAITVRYTGASTTSGTVGVILTLIHQGNSSAPFGSFDTPLNGVTGVGGSVAVTGWALDDVGTRRVAICRDAVLGEVAPVDPNCASNAKIYIGDAIFIDGARTDVQAQNPTFPLNSRGGWGYLMLTNFLPGLGNGTFTLRAYAFDADGHTALLGSKTITCNNADATKPFGAIDTPAQGGVVSGTFANGGWVLTQKPKDIPAGSSTVTVFVDGVSIGNLDPGRIARSDITSLFSSSYDTTHAGGGKIIDTTAFSNGVHTIFWIASDTGSNSDGIGSRFFTISNGSLFVDPASGLVATSSKSMVIAPPSPVDMPHGVAARLGSSGTLDSEIAAAPVDLRAIHGRRGFDLETALQTYTPSSGRIDVQAEELDRVELHLSDTSNRQYSGYLRTPVGLRPLPIGSSLNASTGEFTWMPGVGFYGAYDLTFVRWSAGRAAARQDVRITLNAKGSNRVGPQTIVDLPATAGSYGGVAVARTFYVGGWAADLDATFGTGVDTVHVWAYPIDASGKVLDPIFLGPAIYGGARPDVGAVYGDRFARTGYGMVVTGLPPGTYDLAVFAYSTVVNNFTGAKVVRIVVR